MSKVEFYFVDVFRGIMGYPDGIFLRIMPE